MSAKGKNHREFIARVQKAVRKCFDENGCKPIKVKGLVLDVEGEEQIVSLGCDPGGCPPPCDGPGGANPIC